jgi:hypothetical protein
MRDDRVPSFEEPKPADAGSLSAGIRRLAPAPGVSHGWDQVHGIQSAVAPGR